MSIFLSASALISITRVYNHVPGFGLVTFKLTRGFGYHGQTHSLTCTTTRRCGACAHRKLNTFASPNQNTLGQVTAASTTLGLDLIR
jgi:hypothetical protein